MRRLNVVLVLVFIAFSSLAQVNVEFNKQSFPNQKEALKKAIQNINDGNYYFDLGGSNVDIALDFYLKANDFNPNNALLNFKIGRCFLHVKPISEGIKHLFLAKKINSNVHPDLNLYIAKAFHLNLQFDEAINYYKLYRDNLGPEKAVLMGDDLNRYIFECKTGKQLIENPVRVLIENLGPTINNEYPDYGAVVNIDESIIFYTSRRPSTTGGERSPYDMMYFEDIYWSEMNDSMWMPAENMGRAINTSGHDAIIGVAPDGQTLLLYRDGNGGDIFWSRLKGDKWSKPLAFSNPINSKYQESSASYSYNGKRLYFVSDRPGGYGNKDIYYCDINSEGEWGKAVNIGNVINTNYDEIAVFMHADGKTLYFSSEGHDGMGSFDIYKSIYEDGRWTKPENLGYPINSPDPDVFFSIGASGRNAYFSSQREEGIGGQDIYKIIFLGPEKESVYSTEDPLIASNSSGFLNADFEDKLSLQTSQLTLLKGFVTDDITREPIEATIELVDNEENETLATFQSNSLTGKYLVSLPSGHNYGLAISADGYLFYSENFNIPKAEKFKEVLRNIQLQRVEIGNAIALNNIFFEYKKTNLNKDSKSELDRLASLMNRYPTLKIEVSGHTDNVGDEEYNLDLSLRRAMAVMDYLVENGINRDRMVSKGYGFSKPVESNDTEWGRQRNRRSEIKILSK